MKIIIKGLKIILFNVGCLFCYFELIFVMWCLFLCNVLVWDSECVSIFFIEFVDSLMVVFWKKVKKVFLIEIIVI